MDNEDLPGIALLKEIFPEESTESLRELHYHHIMMNKSQSVSRKSTPSLSRENEKDEETSTVSDAKVQGDEPHSTKFQQDNGIRGDMHLVANGQGAVVTRRFPNAPEIKLPHDFLRLPTSVAVLRPLASADGRLDPNAQYVFISDLEVRALQEYQSTLAGNGGGLLKESETVEYKTFVVHRDDRWGLGMTLQEEEESLKQIQAALLPSSSLAARYGLRVVGFLPDPNKIESGEIISSITTSPAAQAGVRLDDVLIGINGEAFLLPALSDALFSGDLGIHYKNQKAKIVQSIQHSPNPVVLHMRRRKSLIERRSAGDRRTSLLDTTVRDMDEEDPMVMQQRVAASAETFSTPSRLHDSTAARPSPSPSITITPPPIPKFRSHDSIHPFAEALAKRKLVVSRDDQWRISFRLQQFSERARQWEASNSLRLAATNFSLIPYFDPNDLPPDMASLMFFSQSNDRVEKDDLLAVDDHGQQSSTSTRGLQRDHSSQYDAFWGAKCTPSTPPLSVDSPVIPIEYLQAYYGEEQARKIRSSSLINTKSARNRQDLGQKTSLFSPVNGELPASRRLFQNRITLSGNQTHQLYPGKSFGLRSTQRNGNGKDTVWIPLYGIRKSLSARIVNSFVEERRSDTSSRDSEETPRTAYAIWVYDAESGREWYAPIRYWKDFWDLREAAMGLLQPSSTLHQELSSIQFPKEVTIPKSNGLWNTAMFSGASPLSPLQDRRRQRQMKELEEAREDSARALEEFLRELLGAIYTCQPLHPNISEIALYVQSFLGVDSGLAEESIPFVGHKFFKNDSELEEEAARQFLKRSIQRYTWRLFLLHTMKAIVQDFVDSARARGPKLQDIEALEAQGRAVLKSRATEELGRIQAFLDHLVDLILDGCAEDLRMITERREYNPLRRFFSDESYWNRLSRESVREQVEIEVYAPLRSAVSRLLVNGWRHEDMEVHFKIKVSGEVIVLATASDGYNGLALLCYS
jgi:hypothetical protein